jgi:hypothetical protein
MCDPCGGHEGSRECIEVDATPCPTGPPKLSPSRARVVPWFSTDSSHCVQNRGDTTRPKRVIGPSSSHRCGEPVDNTRWREQLSTLWNRMLMRRAAEADPLTGWRTCGQRIARRGVSFRAVLGNGCRSGRRRRNSSRVRRNPLEVRRSPELCTERHRSAPSAARPRSSAGRTDERRSYTARARPLSPRSVHTPRSVLP